MTFSEKLYNKSIIFVGPARSIYGCGWGDWIDSFDIVVRTNGAINLLDDTEYCYHYGNRCDILYVNVQYTREMSPFPLEQWHQHYGLKWVCFKNKPGAKRQKKSHNVGLRWVDPKIGKELGEQIKGLLYGPVVLIDILKHNPKELWATGMDFYRTKPPEFIPGDYREYFKGYLPEKIRRKADVNNIGRVDPHDMYSNTKYIEKLYHQGYLHLDSITQDLMEKTTYGD